MTLQSTVELNVSIPRMFEICENVLYALDGQLFALSKNTFPKWTLKDRSGLWKTVNPCKC